MSQAIRIVQISDCHLPADPQQAYRGIYPHQNLRALLQKAGAFKPDLLLATGDLSEDASRASYSAIQAYFEALGIPVLALPGNHDDAALLAHTFPGSPVDDIAVSNHQQWQIIRLNSSIQGSPEGRLTRQALEQLARLLAQEPQRPRLVALHHQPVAAHSPWIDKYRLLEPRALLDLVTRTGSVKAVVWGHVHRASETEMDGVALLGGPSSAINSLPGKDKFSDDLQGPACRWLELRTDGSVSTRVIR